MDRRRRGRRRVGLDTQANRDAALASRKELSMSKYFNEAAALALRAGCADRRRPFFFGSGGARSSACRAAGSASDSLVVGEWDGEGSCRQGRRATSEWSHVHAWLQRPGVPLQRPRLRGGLRRGRRELRPRSLHDRVLHQDNLAPVAGDLVEKRPVCNAASFWDFRMTGNLWGVELDGDEFGTDDIGCHWARRSSPTETGTTSRLSATEQTTPSTWTERIL